MKVTKQN